MEFANIAEKILYLKNQDDRLRNELIRKRVLSKGYHPQMEELHNQNAEVLDQIMEIIGYPTSEKVGHEASRAAWVIIQHAIGQPSFMKKAAKLMEKAVKENKANAQQLAFLTDRIAVFEGKNQLYGTQFDWDENGEMSPNRFDDLEKVNNRRKAIGLNRLDIQIKLIRERVKRENQYPPQDCELRKRAFDAWRKAVGWVK